MDTNSFIVHGKTNDIYKDMSGDVESRFDISNFQVDKSLPKGKTKKNIQNKNKIDIDSSKEFVKNNTIILKKQNKDLKVKSIRLLQKILTRFF